MDNDIHAMTEEQLLAFIRARKRGTARHRQLAVMLVRRPYLFKAHKPAWWNEISKAA